MEPGPSRDRISDLYHRALECTPEQRRTFLEQACDGDATLRREVESLLRFESQSARFLETPASVVAGDLARTPDSNQMLGRQLGPHRIVVFSLPQPRRRPFPATGTSRTIGSPLLAMTTSSPSSASLTRRESWLFASSMFTFTQHLRASVAPL